jgi:hypothetical protein
MPGPPPPSYAGAAGFAVKDRFDAYVDMDAVIDTTCEVTSDLWEDYYKIENPGWKSDPYSPYYEPAPKREQYLENRPSYENNSNPPNVGFFGAKR